MMTNITQEDAQRMVDALERISNMRQADYMIAEAKNVLTKLHQDWSKARRLDTVISGLAQGEFLNYEPDADHEIKVLVNGHVEFWDEKSCTLLPQTYTELVWHGWTGERPDWVKDDDRVIKDYIDGTRVNCLAKDINWSIYSQCMRFAVIRGE